MTLQTDYALRMLLFLAVRRESHVTIGDVAEGYDLSHNHLFKIARNLRKLGLVQTTRGRSGGICLAKAPEDINVGLLIRMMEDDFGLVECMHADGGACVLSPSCHLRKIVGDALDAYLAVFDRYTLSDLVRNSDALRQFAIPVRELP